MPTEHEALKHVHKDKLVEMVHQAKCGKLLGMRTAEMSKEEIINHLVASRCPVIVHLVHQFMLRHR